jgi:hypothetical protein
MTLMCLFFHAKREIRFGELNRRGSNEGYARNDQFSSVVS